MKTLTIGCELAQKNAELADKMLEIYHAAVDRGEAQSGTDEMLMQVNISLTMLRADLARYAAAVMLGINEVIELLENRE